MLFAVNDWVSVFASTRPVQIATNVQPLLLGDKTLCLHTPRADCNQNHREIIYFRRLCLHTPRADCNVYIGVVQENIDLCLHTLRADCNGC